MSESGKGASSGAQQGTSMAHAIGLVIVAAVVIGLVLLFRDRQPEPTSEPPPPPPAESASRPISSPLPTLKFTLRPDNLPDAHDLEWDSRSDWRVTDYTSAETVCLPRGLERSKGALGGLRRQYVLIQGTGTAAVTVVEFDSAKSAANAARTADEQLRDCTSELERDGHTGVRQLPRRTVPLEQGDAKAEFVEYIYDTADKSDPDSGVFDAQAVAWSGQRVALVTMTVQRQEDYWSFPEETSSDYPLHPMYRSLPRIVERMTAY